MTADSHGLARARQSSHIIGRTRVITKGAVNLNFNIIQKMYIIFIKCINLCNTDVVICIILFPLEKKGKHKSFVFIKIVYMKEIYKMRSDKSQK